MEPRWLLIRAALIGLAVLETTGERSVAVVEYVVAGRGFTADALRPRVGVLVLIDKGSRPVVLPVVGLGELAAELGVEVTTDGNDALCASPWVGDERATPVDGDDTCVMEAVVAAALVVRVERRGVWRDDAFGGVMTCDERVGTALGIPDNAAEVSVYVLSSVFLTSSPSSTCSSSSIRSVSISGTVLGGSLEGGLSMEGLDG